MNPTSKSLALHLHQVFFGGNWTYSNLREVLKDIDLAKATANRNESNSIALLTFHIGYFVSALLTVMQEKPLIANDKYSFTPPPLNTDDDWNSMVSSIFNEVEILVKLIDAMPDDKLWETFVEEKYGNYFRNINGVIEHTHYHLGQIPLLKKGILSN